MAKFPFLLKLFVNVLKKWDALTSNRIWGDAPFTQPKEQYNIEFNPNIKNLWAWNDTNFFFGFTTLFPTYLVRDVVGGRGGGGMKIR